MKRQHIIVAGIMLLLLFIFRGSAQAVNCTGTCRVDCQAGEIIRTSQTCTNPELFCCVHPTNTPTHTPIPSTPTKTPTPKPTPSCPGKGGVCRSVCNVGETRDTTGTCSNPTYDCCKAPTPTPTPLPPTCPGNGGTCRSICNAGETRITGTCSNATYDCCQAPAPTPATCASNGGTCMDACVSPDVEITGTCTNALYVCCGTYVAPPCDAPKECRQTCLTPSQVEDTSHTCSNPSYKCCIAATPTPTPIGCVTTGCTSGEYTCGTCPGGVICCPTITPAPGSGTYSLTCAKRIDCNIRGCQQTEAWIEYNHCLDTFTTYDANNNPIRNPGNCQFNDGCIAYGGACSSDTLNCTGCNPTRCTNTCGLGGCPGGCGNVM